MKDEHRITAVLRLEAKGPATQPRRLADQRHPNRSRSRETERTMAGPEGRKRVAHGASRGMAKPIRGSQPRQGRKNSAAPAGARPPERPFFPYGLRRGLSSFGPPGLAQADGQGK